MESAEDRSELVTVANDRRPAIPDEPDLEADLDGSVLVVVARSGIRRCPARRPAADAAALPCTGHLDYPRPRQ